MTRYTSVFENALKAYTNKTERAGYKFGFFSFLRHSFKKTPTLENLESLLSKAENDQAAVKIIKNFLNDKRTKFNNHSFANYLLDHLIEECPHESWEVFRKDPVIFCRGILYRGTRQSPQDAFKNGMRALTNSDAVNDYTCSMSGAVGISTSKVITIAETYASPSFTACKDPLGTPSDQNVTYGYVFKINYRGIGGVDIDATSQIRGKTISSLASKQEVNVIDHIPAEDIEGAWKMSEKEKGQFIPNPSYKPNKSLEESKSIVERLASLFKKPAANQCKL